MLTSELDRQETKLIEALTLEMRDKGLKESTIRAIVTTDLLPTNKHLEKMFFLYLQICVRIMVYEYAPPALLTCLINNEYIRSTK